MKRALLLLLVASPALAEVKTTLYPSGALAERFDTTSGLFEAWAEDCQIVARGHMKAGKRDGAWTEWNSENGAKTREGSYVAGVRQGVWTFYGPKGEKQTQGPFVDGKAQGTFTEWFATGGKWREFQMDHGVRVDPRIADCEAKGGEWKIDYKEGEEGCAVKDKEIGTWIGYYPTGAVKWRIPYVDGYRQGTGEELHPTGELLHRGEWIGGIPEGTHTWQSATGKVYGTSTINDGNGEVHEFSPDGRHTIDVAYVGGSAQGVWRRYYDNGALAEETTYVAGEKAGPYRRYHVVGELATAGTHDNGVRVGGWVELWENGKVKWAGTYDATGRKTGLWMTFSYAGQLESSGTMQDDHEEGTWMYFHDTGALAATGTMKMGDRVGTWQTFWADGKPWRTVEYAHGKEVGPAPASCDKIGGDWVADAKKRELGCQVCRAKPDDSIEQIATGVWTWWHPNGQIEKQGALDSGKQVGRWSFFYDNGKPMLEGDYAAGAEQGSWLGYYRSGDKRVEGAYTGGKPSGTWTSWYETGNPMSEGRYDGGKKTGEWIYYDRSGKPEKVSY